MILSAWTYQIHLCVVSYSQVVTMVQIAYQWLKGTSNPGLVAYDLDIPTGSAPSAVNEDELTSNETSTVTKRQSLGHATLSSS
jgi:hypothetical protein